MKDVWYLYLIKCRDGSLYAGVTKDLEERAKKHNKGLGSKYTAGRRPVKLVYAEKHPNQRLAMKREIEIKKWSREKKQLLIKNHGSVEYA